MLVRVIMAASAAVLMVAGPAVADADPNDSDLYAWGYNAGGQLGDGTNVTAPSPVKVNTSGALAGKRISSVSGGGGHSCAIAEGVVYCWGNNGAGQLGRVTGATIEPGPVGGLLEGKTVTTVSAGHQHTCAVADGQLFCWGWNGYGQLGIGPPGPGNYSSPTPVAVNTGDLAGKTVTAVSAGWGATCATDSDGDAYCWGVGSVMGYPQPTRVADGAAGPVTSLRASEEHACYVQNGKAYCGGVNLIGEAGIGVLGGTNFAAVVASPGVLEGRTVTTIRTGKRSTCALADAKLFCWGSNQYGQLGTGTAGTPPYSVVPVEVPLPAPVVGEPVTALTAGENFNCMVVNGSPYCWGANPFGQLGDGSLDLRPSPTAVDATGVLAGKRFRTFSAGANHMLFLAQQAPTTPREATAQVTGFDATVSWQPPVDDGGAAVAGYRVTAGGVSCETAGLSCTLSGLAAGTDHTVRVVARNAVGDSAAATVKVQTGPAAVIAKSKQSFTTPKKVKKRGTTVIVKKGAKTSAGVPVTTTVKAKGKVKVLRKGGAVTVKPLGKKWRVAVTLNAPGTDTHEPFSQRIVYKNGKRR